MIAAMPTASALPRSSLFAIPLRPGSERAWACASAALLVALFPIAHVVGAAASNSGDALAWVSIWLNGTLLGDLAQTLWVCAVAALVAIAASAPQAVAVGMFTVRGGWAIELAAMAPMLLAPYAAAGAWSGLDFGGLTHGALAMAFQVGFSCAPWSYMALRVAIARLPPSLGEAAAAAGMPLAGRIARVWLPLLSAPILGTALFAAARAFGDYGTAERNGIRTFGVAFHDIWNGAQSQQVASIVALVAVLPALALTWAVSARAQRHSPRPVAGAAGAAGMVKAPPSRALLLAIWVWSASCLTLAFLLPEWQYLSWAIAGKWMSWAKALAVVLDALATSGAVAAGLALAGGACALMLRPGAQGGGAERAIWLVSINLFVPPMALALAWLSATADGAWFAQLLGSARDGKFPLLLAQSAKLAPFALLPVLDRLARENESLREALRAAGKGRLELWGHVLRMAAPAIALGAAMVFMEALKELEIAITLQHFGYRSPAIKIHAMARFHSEHTIANWVLISQALMLPALAVVTVWLSRIDKTRSQP